jgi:hypothetical protein
VLPEDAHLIATVHDELILDCPADTAEQYSLLCSSLSETFCPTNGSQSHSSTKVTREPKVL